MVIKNSFDINKPKIAYFSMEIGLLGKIPTYSGGLGVLAGDFLRSAADVDIPLIGISLIYKKGYFKQRIDNEGNQVEENENWNPSDYMIKLPNKIKVKIRGREVSVCCWLYKLMGINGNILPVIFLDTDLSENSPYDRSLSYHLYGEDNEYRISQEIVLGIGGVRILDDIGVKVDKYHMNEGHSAFLALELYKKFNKDKLENVRKKCIFTTHTPVPAGHDQFERKHAEEVLGENINIDIKEKLFLNGFLNMTNIGMRFSSHINGVAKKHEEVSRKMFPDYHIESITNGVHSLFWTCEPMRKLYDKYLGNWREDSFNLRYIMSVPKEEILKAHQKSKEKLIKFVNKKFNAHMDVDTFTIGFARRFASYKRGDMLFYNKNKLIEIAKKYKGIQIIYSGKAHPKDGEGKEIIKRIVKNIGELKGKVKIVFIENYDIDVSKMLVSGVDLWLNTPLRPKEASGTSGMKAAHNGVPQFSTLDGWWLEGHIENVTGWSIGPYPDGTNDYSEEDLEDLYAKLEYVILPLYYDSKDKWAEIMRHTVAINASFFNTHRMLQQYVLSVYFK